MIRVRLFASCREALGAAEIRFAIPGGGRVADVMDRLVAEHPALAPHRPHLLYAINCEYAGETDLLQEGDELALIPPVSGG